MRVTPEIKAQVEEKIRERLTFANQRFNLDITMPAIQYTLRGTTAGTANCHTWVINLNPVLLMENTVDFIERTPVHELAHLIDYKLHPENFRRTYGSKRSVHGPTWKRIMMILGADPSRCHSFDTTNARTKTSTQHTWTCRCGSVMVLGPKRHAKMLSGRSRYWQHGHARCGGYTYNTPTARAYTFGTGAGRQQAAANAQANARAATEKPAEVKSWKETSLTVFQRVNGDRGLFIKAMVNLGMKSVTASTYHHNIKSGKWC